MKLSLLALSLLSGLKGASGLSASSPTTTSTSTPPTTALQEEKAKLLDLLQANPRQDPILVDPVTKESITISAKKAFLGGSSNARKEFSLVSPSNTYSGSSDTFLNLLEPVEQSSTDEKSASVGFSVFNAAVPFIPPPLRSALATAGLPVGEEYVPMRDLFTSPSVSFAYERGWRQGFARAGFPGPEQEAAMAMEYFAPAMAMGPLNETVLVDMSCATGLFTRRFAASEKYSRVLGCDYSDSMLLEAGRRIRADAPELLQSRRTQLDLVRLDVGQIPMRDGCLNGLHAGAAMHCWPDLGAAMSEIYRVLKPGGRYFATTFLSSYFGVLQQAEGGATGPSRQAFQYFGSVEELRDLVVSGGFEREKVMVEVLGAACVVIRAEK